MPERAPPPVLSGGPDEAGPRCGFIAVLGAPNAGKSTLVNTLTGAKVAIVSRKAQTTRRTIRGIAIEDGSQLVFVDTPGIFTPRRRLDRAMVGAAWDAAAEADVVLFLADAGKSASEVAEGSHGILARLAPLAMPKLLVLNKVDRLEDKTRLLTLAAELTKQAGFERVFMISALTGDGTRDLKAHLARLVPPGPWLYPEDEISDVPQRVLAAEITREQIYHRLHQELPYASTVETTSWTERPDGSVRIEQTVYVARESQRRIVLGAGGRAIKQISQDSRLELERLLERRVHLFLFVKVRENWEQDPERYREMGLEFPRG